MHSERVKNFILAYFGLEKKSAQPDVDQFLGVEYLKAGYLDSIRLIKFIVEIEVAFDIEISDDDMLSEDFRTIGGLIDLIERKLNRT